MKGKYILGVTITILLVLINQAIIQYFIYQKKYDARTINLAGRQRMLSQLVNLERYRVSHESSSLADLKNPLDEWKSVHYGLLIGNDTLNIKHISNEKALILLESLTSKVEFTYSILKYQEEVDDETMRKIDANQKSYLIQMNTVVKILEEASTEKLFRLIIIEVILAIFSLLVIIGEVLFIYKPIAKKANESQAFLSSIIDNVPGLLMKFCMSKDNTDTILFISKGVEDIWGISQEDAKSNSQKIWTKIHQEDRKPLFEAILNSRKNLEDLYFEYRVVKNNNETIWISTRAKPQRITNDKTIWNAVVLNVTELKNYEKMLHKKNEKLRIINNELDQLIYQISHNLRAPLTSSMGLLDIMEIENKINISQNPYFPLLKESLNKQDELIKNLLVFSKSIKSNIQLSTFKMYDFVDSIINNLDKPNESIEFEVGKKNFQITTDKNRLDIIIRNLIANAIKYIEPLRGKCLIKLDYKLVGKTLKIEVYDNGIGIHPNYIDKVFDMFFRADNNYAGSGLGLYIAQYAAHKLGGEITVESEVNKYSRFLVTIPLDTQY